MRVKIDQKDYEALHFAMEQVESALEGSENIEWNKNAKKALKRLYDISERYWLERAKAHELNEARSLVRRINRWMPPKDVDKLARRYLKDKKKNSPA